MEPCSVYFIGAGPGDPELLTLKARRLIERADLVLYAGSLVPREVVESAGGHARVVDSSSLTLAETHGLIVETVKSGGMVARVHTGDPSLYGAVREQAALLDREGIPYEVIPGVTAAFAAAAAARVSFTVPENTQTLIVTRLAGKTPVPEKERLRELARHGASLAIYLSAANPEAIVEELIAGGYPEDTPVIVGHRVGWSDQIVIKTVLKDTADAVAANRMGRQVVFLVLPGEGAGPSSSRLYSPEFSHGFRKGNG